MTSTTVHIGLTENSRSSSNSRVLKPPGGGSSDIFGTNANPTATPRNVKNHLASNIFTNEKGVKNCNSGENRRNPVNDSHNRLFGETNRPYTPAKNHMKSSIPIGGSGGNGASPVANGKPMDNGMNSNGSAGENGGDKINGDIISLNGNGIAKSANGNPVTGEGYNKIAATSEINTTVPSLNGAKEVINKNRVPPGGYSSGLW